MDAPNHRSMIRVCILAGFSALFILGMLVVFPASARDALAAPGARAPFWQETQYPVGATTEVFGGYPAMTDTMEAELPTLTLTMTPTDTSTPPPDIFRTENAEMGSGLVTPPPSETPGPTITSYVSPTPLSASLHPTQKPAAPKRGGLNLDWGLFWIGFSIPVVGACGAVLYLLDRRPDLFSPRSGR